MDNIKQLTPIINKPTWWALTPLLVFLALYLITSIIINDFYKVPITVAFVISSVYAVCITRGLSINNRIQQFSKGASDKNILMMIWIFILAGAFAQSAKAMGSIDATVHLTLALLPANLVLAGIFLASCFISISIGTSVGTIVALMPVAAGIAEASSVSMPFIAAIVVGGAFFGDNLSFISDTTIAATRTQGCKMSDKFKVNFQLAGTAALLVLIAYIYLGWDLKFVISNDSFQWIKIIPYFIVLVSALLGMHVMLVLLLGILSCGIIGISTGSFSLLQWYGAMGDGIMGMGELIIVTLLAGGMLELVRFNGGIDYILLQLTRRIKNKRGAEFSIAGLVSLANLCTANNTIAIITVGKLASQIAEEYRVDKRRSASLLDIFSCIVQGIIPYGAQMLLASKLAGSSPVSIIQYLYYPITLLGITLLSIIFRIPRRYTGE